MVRATEEQNLFYSIVIGLNLNGHILMATVLGGIDVKVTVGVWDSQLSGILTWTAGYLLAVQGPLPRPSAHPAVYWRRFLCLLC